MSSSHSSTTANCPSAAHAWACCCTLAVQSKACALLKGCLLHGMVGGLSVVLDPAVRTPVFEECGGDLMQDIKSLQVRECTDMQAGMTALVPWETCWSMPHPHRDLPLAQAPATRTANSC